MSNRDPDLDYRGPQHTLPLVIEQAVKKLHTAMPGHVETYDETSRRATVRGAVHLRLTDGSLRPRPLVTDIPVVWPASGGYLLRAPVPKGTPVLLVFSMRGMRQFLARFEPGAPGAEGLLSERDAMAIPGFGPAPPALVTPATDTGASLQSDDGERFVSVDVDQVVVEAFDRRVTITRDAIAAEIEGTTLDLRPDGVTIRTAGEVAIESAALTHNGTNVGDTHVHGGVMAGGSVTAPPS